MVADEFCRLMSSPWTAETPVHRAVLQYSRARRHRQRERARQIEVDLNSLGGLEIDPHGAQLRVVEVEVNGLERWERKGFYSCRRFVLTPMALVIGRRAVAKVLPCFLLGR
jgi:hypothetical protein